MYLKFQISMKPKAEASWIHRSQGRHHMNAWKSMFIGALYRHKSSTAISHVCLNDRSWSGVHETKRSRAVVIGWHKFCIIAAQRYCKTRYIRQGRGPCVPPFIRIMRHWLDVPKWLSKSTFYSMQGCWS